MEADGRHKLYEFAGGVIYLDVEESPMMRRRAEGTYEPEKVSAIQQYARPDMTFVDAGANKGDFSLIAARAVGPGGRVLAFEPAAGNLHWIRLSIEANGYRNIRLFDVALSDADGQADLFTGSRSGWHSLHPGGQATGAPVTVVTRALDSVLAEIGNPPVDMIKVDVEGAELEVLRGAATALEGTRPLFVMVDIHPQRDVDPTAVCELLATHRLSAREPADPVRRIESVPEDLTELFAVRAWPGL